MRACCSGRQGRASLLASAIPSRGGPPPFAVIRHGRRRGRRREPLATMAAALTGMAGSNPIQSAARWRRAQGGLWAARV